MIKHFVSPPERTDWRMDPDEIARALQARWPRAHINDGPFPAGANRSLEWRIGEFDAGASPDGGTEGLLEGALSREADTLILAGDLRDCVEVAVWVRKLVPAEQRLLFYDDALMICAEIKEEMGEEQLLAALSGEPVSPSASS